MKKILAAGVVAALVLMSPGTRAWAAGAGSRLAVVARPPSAGRALARTPPTLGAILVSAATPRVPAPSAQAVPELALDGAARIVADAGVGSGTPGSFEGESVRAGRAWESGAARRGASAVEAPPGGLPPPQAAPRLERGGSKRPSLRNVSRPLDVAARRRIHNGKASVPLLAGLLAFAALAAAPLVFPAGSMAALGIVSQIAYYTANLMGCVFPLTMSGKLFASRSGDIPLATPLIGMGASLLLGFNFAYLPNAFAASLQNLFGGVVLAFVVVQKWWYDRHPGGAMSRVEAVFKTAAVAALAGLAALLLSGGLSSLLPSLPVGGLIIPFQVLSGLGFAALSFPEYLKTEKSRSVGATSEWTARAYFLASFGVGIWAMHRLTLLLAGPPQVYLSAIFVLVGALAVGGVVFVRGLSRRDWGPRSESRATAAGLAAVSALLLAAFGAASWLLGSFAGGVPGGNSVEWRTYLFYVVESTLACVVTGLTLRALRRSRAASATGREAPSGEPDRG